MLALGKAHATQPIAVLKEIGTLAKPLSPLEEGFGVRVQTKIGLLYAHFKGLAGDVAGVGALASPLLGGQRADHF